MARLVILGTDTVADALATKVNNNDSEADATKTEVEAARDGETDLITKINAIDSAILALVAGGGVLITTNDTTVGVLDDKLTIGTINPVTLIAGDDTLTAAELTPFYKTTNNAGANENISLGYGCRLFHNTSAGVDAELELPAAVVGREGQFLVVDSYYIRLTADGTNVFSYGGDSSAAGGYIRTNAPGVAWRIRCYVTGIWQVLDLNGELKVDE